MKEFGIQELCYKDARYSYDQKDIGASICPTIRVIYVGPDTLDGPEPRGLPPQGLLLADGDTAMAMRQRGVVLTIKVLFEMGIK